MSKIKKIVALLLSVCLLTACQNEQVGTNLNFSFHTSEVTDSNDEKIIYINETKEKIELNASLEIDCGEVLVQVVSAEDDATVWENSYEESTDFVIELQEVKADSKYILKIQTVETKNVNLTITSSENLVEDKEKPAR